MIVLINNNKNNHLQVSKIKILLNFKINQMSQILKKTKIIKNKKKNYLKTSGKNIYLRFSRFTQNYNNSKI